MKLYRPTFAEIDLSAMRHNIRKVRDLVGRKVKILGVVKADAYGHGMKEVSRAILAEGVDYLGVSSLDEARELRNSSIKAKIIVLGTILPGEAEGVLKFNVTQTVTDLKIARILSQLGQKHNRKVKVHIKVDTGMGRLGVWYDQSAGFIKSISRLKNIEIEGIFTHFPSAEEDVNFTRGQIRKFNHLIEELLCLGISIPIKHTSNSMALIGLKDSRMNMVRAGLVIYGIYPKSDLTRKIKLRPVLSLKTRICYIKKVPKGRSISYGRSYITKRDTKIATIPIGYGDGYSRALSNKAFVLIRGKSCPIVGRVCMDMTMVDVGHLKKVSIGDEVVLIGKQGKENIKVDQLAKVMRTISYEVVCSIGHRVPRVYIK